MRVGKAKVNPTRRPEAAIPSSSNVRTIPAARNRKRSRECAERPAAVRLSLEGMGKIRIRGFPARVWSGLTESTTTR